MSRSTCQGLRLLCVAAEPGFAGLQALTARKVHPPQAGGIINAVRRDGLQHHDHALIIMRHGHKPNHERSLAADLEGTVQVLRLGRKLVGKLGQAPPFPPVVES